MIKKELCVIADTYTNRDGEEKKRWLKVGEIHTSKDGKEYMTLDPIVNLAAIPRREGDSRIFVSMFDPKPRENKGGSGGGGYTRQEEPPFDPDDDIHFVSCPSIYDVRV